MNRHRVDIVDRRGSHLTSGRKFNADELQLMLLWLLRDLSAHGYELINRFNDLSHGYYRPSPGVLYPALAQLQAIGFAQIELNGKRKTYQITPAGHEYLLQHSEHAQQLLAILKHAAKRMLWVSQANLDEAAAADATGWLPEFVQARKALKIALLAKTDADHAEQRRVITILERAVKDMARGCQVVNNTIQNNL